MEAAARWQGTDRDEETRAARRPGESRRDGRRSAGVGQGAPAEQGRAGGDGRAVGKRPGRRPEPVGEQGEDGAGGGAWAQPPPQGRARGSRAGAQQLPALGRGMRRPDKRVGGADAFPGLASRRARRPGLPSPLARMGDDSRGERAGELDAGEGTLSRQLRDGELLREDVGRDVLRE